MNSNYKQLEDDCKKWFTRCEELSTESRQLKRKINQLSKENDELKYDRELKLEVLSRFQHLKNDNDRLYNLLVDIRSYLIDDIEWGEIVATIDAGLEE